MSQLKTNSIANVAGTASTDVLNVINGSAKAWVNFNGSGTVAIRQGYNVSSITDNGTGDYTINFTNALADANYTPVGMGAKNNNELITITQPFGATPPTTSAVRVQSVFVNGSPTDVLGVYVAIFR